MLNHVDNQRSRFPDLEILITTMKGLSGRLQDLAEKLLPMVRNDMSKVALAFKYDEEFAEYVMEYLYEEVEVAQIDSDRE
jgi:DNA-binding sugar fermentation-stimulating protein